MAGVGQRFDGVSALRYVSPDLYAESVPALVGEWGTGKSTLMRILTGTYPKRGEPIFMADQGVNS